jgi:hypothetical protein
MEMFVPWFDFGFSDFAPVDRVSAFDGFHPAPGHDIVRTDPRVSAIEERSLGGFIDRAFAYRIVCDRAVYDDLLREVALTPVAPHVRREAHAAFAAVVRRDVRHEGEVRITPGFDFRERGGDGHFLASLFLADEQILYLWFKRNF